MGIVGVTWPVFKILVSSHIFGITEAKNFRFLVLIHTEEY